MHPTFLSSKLRAGRRRHAGRPFFTLAATALFWACADAGAQTVVITGAREPLDVNRLAADVALIEPATLRDTMADSVADLLRREAGLQLSRSGGPGQATGLFVRGTASQQSLVLVDGVRIGSATLGYAAAEALGLSQIDRVEVLRGPGSSVYGADAVGGVVNLITRRGSGAPQVDGQLSVGGYGSSAASLGVRGASAAGGLEAGIDYAASLASERSRGISALRPGDPYGNYNPDRDGYRLDSAHFSLGYKPARGQRIGLSMLGTRLNSQYDASEYLPPNYEQNAAPDFRSRLRTAVAALDWRGDLATGLVGSARLTRSEDDASSGGTQTDRFRTVRELVSGQLAWQTGAWGQLVGVAEAQRDQARSTSYDAPVARRTQALALELTGSAGAWSWQGDARRDHRSDFGAVNTARLGGGYALASGLRLRALAGTTFRAPSFNDLVYPGYGVPTLQPERGQSIEMGLQWHADLSEAAATVYRNRVRDLIAYESDNSRCPNDPAYSYGCAANVDRAQLKGATFSGLRRLGAWTLKAQVDVLQALDIGSGAHLPRRATQQSTLAADWTAARISAGASVLHLGERPDGGKTLAAETTLDLNARWRLAPAWALQAKLLNATNRDIQPVLGYQGLGRQAWLVLRYEPQS